jgi:hypothetical protein
MTAYFERAATALFGPLNSTAMNNFITRLVMVIIASLVAAAPWVIMVSWLSAAIAFLVGIVALGLWSLLLPFNVERVGFEMVLGLCIVVPALIEWWPVLWYFGPTNH